LQELTPDRLQAWNKQNVSPSNTTVYVIGDVTLKDVQPLVDRTLGRWTSDARPDPKPMGRAAPSRARVVLIDQPGAAQSSINVAYSLPPYDPETSTELSVLNAVLGGAFESRLNLNLREDKGWSYGLRSRIESNFSGDQYLVAGGSVQSDKTIESMREIVKELDELNSSRPVTQEEFESQVQNKIRVLAAASEMETAVNEHMITADARGLPYDRIEGEQERLASLTLDGIRDRARKEIRSNRLTWVVIGDLSMIEGAVRALDYGDIEVWDVNGDRLR
jgi:predicted Zn-dependent peptidase